MMNKIIISLVCLLGLQLVLAGALWFVDARAEQQAQHKPLLTLDSKSLGKIDIKGKEAVLSLVRKENQWQFADYPELPVAPLKLSSVVDELSTKKVTWPMTQTKASHERFSLTEDNFEKQMVVSDTHGASETLIVGKSPSFKQTYVRHANEDAVFLIDFNVYQLSTDVNDWLDKSLFSISEITKVEHAKVNLEKQDDKWQLAKSSTLAKEQVLEHEHIQQFVDKIKNLRVTGLAEGEFKPVHHLSVVDANNTEFTYQFAEDNEQYYVKRSDVRYWFTVGQSSFDTVAQLSLEKFVSNKDSQQEESTITSE